MAEEQIDIKIKTVLAQATNEFNRLTSAASNFDKTLVNVVQRVDLLNKTVTTTATSADGMKKVIQTVDENGNKLKETFVDLSKQGKKTKTSLSSVFDLNRLYLYWNLTKRLRDNFKKIITSAVEFNETQNKFNVSMGTAEKDATRFVNKITEAVGIGTAELMNYQSTYKNILSGLGNFSDQQSEKISESLVKMALDYSSLFNVERSAAMNKFQAALTGSIRPIRSDSGFDVSEQTVGEKAKELGIERTVGQLTQMEKRILRIIVLMDQMRRTGAMDDLARTIEEPANQIKVLQDQIQELGVWIGNVFMGTIGSVLPYINAFVMVLKEIVRTLAIFVGYESTSNGFQDAFEVAEDAAEGIAGGVGSANKSAKELRKTLMGFDVLNVITTPKESDSSGGGGVGSIDPKILSALDEYDSLMENVRMKATDIRDKIMDWLGFTKIIDPLTGEVTWELENGYTKLELILDTVKGIGLGLLAWKLSKFFTDGLTDSLTNMQKLRLLTGAITLSIGAITILNGVNENDLKQKFIGILEVGLGSALLFKSFKAGALGLTIATGVTFAVSAIKWIVDNHENSKNMLFGGKEDLTFAENLDAANYSFWTGVAVDFGSLFGFDREEMLTAWNQFWLDAQAGYEKWLYAFAADVEVALDEKAWEQYFSNVRTGLENFLGDVTTQLTGHEVTWEEFSSTVTDSSAWEQYFEDVGEGYRNWKDDIGKRADELWTKLDTGWTNFKTNTKKTFTSLWEDHIAPWFTWEKWEGLADNALNALKTAFENFRLPDIKLPHFEIDYETNGKIAEAFQKMGLQGKPNLKVNWYADGGLPDVGELFVAREAGPELVGKIGNSNAVMNNQQIVQAVSTGVARAVASVIGNNRGNNQPIQLFINEREIAYATRGGQGRIDNIFGTT